MAPASSPVAAGEQWLTYDLCVRAENRVSYPADQGIRLGADRIGWTVNGRACQAPFSDIAAIHLTPPIMTAPVAAVSAGSDMLPVITGGPIITPALCAISFNDGGQLTVLNTAASGSYDRARATQYRDFVVQLHQRLGAARRSSIDFGSGASERRYALNKMLFTFCACALVILGLFLLHSAGPPAFGAILFFGPVLWFVHRVVRATAPRRYDPEHVPEGLLTVHALPYAPPDEKPGPMADLVQRVIGTPDGRRATIIALCAAGTLAILVVAGVVISADTIRETDDVPVVASLAPPPAPPPAPPRISADTAFANAKAAYERREYGEALRWYQEAAVVGDAAAQVNLGTLYAFGQGVAQDHAEAVQWFRKAADQGLAEAQYDIAIAYEAGQGVAQDYAEALRWYQKAADQGLDRAQNNLGHLYHDGLGVAPDYAEALRWYRKAADQGYDAAQLHIGTMYVTGRGVAPDYAEALRWYRKAADQGVPAAQYDVGLIYANGLGVPPDPATARQWMTKAAAGGHDKAQASLAANQPR